MSSNKLFSQIHVARNARQSHSGGYGRPKTRSPFPNSAFSHNCSLFSRGGQRQIICIGSRAVQKPSLLLAGRRVTPTRPAEFLAQSSMEDRDPEEAWGREMQSRRGTKAARHFASLPRRDDGAGALESENSFKLTFYNPSLGQNEEVAGKDPRVFKECANLDYGLQACGKLQRKSIRINEPFNKAVRSPML